MYVDISKGIRNQYVLSIQNVYDFDLRVTVCALPKRRLLSRKSGKCFLRPVFVIVLYVIILPLFIVIALLAVLSQESFQNVMPNQKGIWSCRYLQNYEPEPLPHGNDEAINNNFFHKLKKVIKKSKQGIKELIRKREEKKILKKQQLDEMSRINSLKYEQIMQKWQMKLNVFPRKKRSANELQNFFNRIKNIIPGYLRGKVKPVVDKKKGNVSRNTKRHHGRRTRKPHQKRHTTLKTTTVRQK